MQPLGDRDRRAGLRGHLAREGLVPLVHDGQDAGAAGDLRVGDWTLAERLPAPRDLGVARLGDDARAAAVRPGGGAPDRRRRASPRPRPPGAATRSGAPAEDHAAAEPPAPLRLVAVGATTFGAGIDRSSTTGGTCAVRSNGRDAARRSWASGGSPGDRSRCRRSCKAGTARRARRSPERDPTARASGAAFAPRRGSGLGRASSRSSWAPSARPRSPPAARGPDVRASRRRHGRRPRPVPASRPRRPTPTACCR